jgi:hypothetical protein
MTHIGVRVYLTAIGMFVRSLLARSSVYRDRGRRRDTSYFDPY